MTPLHWAALGGNVKVVEELLSLEQFEEFPEELEELCTADAQQRSPLHLAAHKGHAAAASILLEKGPQDLSSRVDANKRTPLHLAAMRGNLDCLQVLIKDPRTKLLVHHKDVDGN